MNSKKIWKYIPTFIVRCDVSICKTSHKNISHFLQDSTSKISTNLSTEGSGNLRRELVVTTLTLPSNGNLPNRYCL